MSRQAIAKLADLAKIGRAWSESPVGEYQRSVILRSSPLSPVSIFPHQPSYLGHCLSPSIRRGAQGLVRHVRASTQGVTESNLAGFE
jgi:hypothetical protein